MRLTVAMSSLQKRARASPNRLLPPQLLTPTSPSTLMIQSRVMPPIMTSFGLMSASGRLACRSHGGLFGAGQPPPANPVREAEHEQDWSGEQQDPIVPHVNNLDLPFARLHRRI